jgi:RNA polymerase sigma-70 factor (ECF subfamily)
MPESRSDTDWLLDQAQQGDREARERLLGKYRERMRRMIALRLDRRLAARVDPSDVIQESLVEADRLLSDYLKERPVPFYLWLRHIAWQRLIMTHRQHLDTGKRSVKREEQQPDQLSDESMAELARRLLARGSSPSAGLLRQENKERLESALLQLSERDREVLVLRYLEQLSLREVATILGIKEGAVKLRQLRAVERLGSLLGKEGEEQS